MSPYEFTYVVGGFMVHSNNTYVDALPTNLGTKVTQEYVCFGKASKAVCREKRTLAVFSQNQQNFDAGLCLGVLDPHSWRPCT